jgi:hypothetical protein
MIAVLESGTWETRQSRRWPRRLCCLSEHPSGAIIPCHVPNRPGQREAILWRLTPFPFAGLPVVAGDATLCHFTAPFVALYDERYEIPAQSKSRRRLALTFPDQNDNQEHECQIKCWACTVPARDYPQSFAFGA